MKCAVHMHDPCKGPVRVRPLTAGATVREVPLCREHLWRWSTRDVPFRWQTDEQLERWARDAAARATHG